MDDLVSITILRLVPAPPRLAETGLLAWATCTIAGIVRLDGLSLRRTRGGRVAVTYPARRSSDGLQHPFALPLDWRVRRALEDRLIAEAERRGLLAKAPDGHPRCRSLNRDQVPEVDF